MINTNIIVSAITCLMAQLPIKLLIASERTDHGIMGRGIPDGGLLRYRKWVPQQRGDVNKQWSGDSRPMGAWHGDTAVNHTNLLYLTSRCGRKIFRINLCPYASKYWRFKSFILHFISPFTITHLFKWLRTSFFSLLISILSSFCWNAEVLICKAFSDWSKFCLLLSFCYLKL